MIYLFYDTYTDEYGVITSKHHIMHHDCNVSY